MSKERGIANWLSGQRDRLLKAAPTRRWEKRGKLHVPAHETPAPVQEGKTIGELPRRVRRGMVRRIHVAERGYREGEKRYKPIGRKRSMPGGVAFTKGALEVRAERRHAAKRRVRAQKSAAARAGRPIR